jgi:hypothetical protein
MDSVQIMTTGNAVDFGDLAYAVGQQVEIIHHLQEDLCREVMMEVVILIIFKK